VYLEVVTVAAIAYVVAQVLDNRIEVLENIVAFVYTINASFASTPSSPCISPIPEELLGITALLPTLPVAL
jgi:hypothetical protein